MLVFILIFLIFFMRCMLIIITRSFVGLFYMKKSSLLFLATVQNHLPQVGFLRISSAGNVHMLYVCHLVVTHLLLPPAMPLFKQHLRWAPPMIKPCTNHKASFLLFIKCKQKCKRMKFPPNH